MPERWIDPDLVDLIKRHGPWKEVFRSLDTPFTCELCGTVRNVCITLQNLVGRRLELCPDCFKEDIEARVVGDFAPIVNIERALARATAYQIINFYQKSGRPLPFLPDVLRLIKPSKAWTSTELEEVQNFNRKHRHVLREH